MALLTNHWRDLDAAARERAYSPSSCTGGNYRPFVQAYAQRSRAAKAQAACRTLRYGQQAQERLDLFLPVAAANGAAPPLLVFIHGGYWQELGKDDSAFAAADCVGQGLAYAALDYSLAPGASVAQMVAQCRRAVCWLHSQSVALGFDARRIVVAGSSAGAQLAAMVALPGQGPDNSARCIRGAVLVSGIFELEPLVGTSINQALGLMAQTARELSPALQPLQGFAPSIVCWGEVETAEFKRQSRDFAAALRAAGTPCQAFEVPRRNHFDIVFDLADPATELGRSVIAVTPSPWCHLFESHRHAALPTANA